MIKRTLVLLDVVSIYPALDGPAADRNRYIVILSHETHYHPRHYRIDIREEVF